MRIGKLPLLFDLLLVFVLWQVAAVALQVPFLPSPLTVLATFGAELFGGLGRHLAVSAARVLLGIGLATALGAGLALVAAQIRAVDRLLTPLAFVVYPVPKIVFLPMFLLFLGLGNVSKIGLIAFTVSFQVFVVVRDAASRIRPETLDSVRSVGATRWQLFRCVYVPASMPALLTALRISTSTAIAILFFAESFATTTGLGYYVMAETWGRAAYADMYAGVLAMSLMGLALYYLIETAERRFCAWSRATATT